MSAKKFVGGLAAALLITTSPQAEEVWTLSRSVEHALAVAPELRVAEAELGARRGDLMAASAWPNPTLSVRADEKLGIEDGRGGVDLTQLAVIQPLPFGRRAPRIKAAEAGIRQAEDSRQARRLMLENRVAQAFHTLQLTSERLQLAEERQKFAEGLRQSGSTRRDRLARYLSPLERTRLAILHEQAHQEVANAEGKFSEALTAFRAALALPADITPQTAPLAPVSPPPPLAHLAAALEAHPELAAGRSALAAAQADVEVARRERLAEPTLQIFRENDFLAGQRQSYNGVMLGVQVPVWGRNEGGVIRARSRVDAAQAQVAMVQRDLQAQLAQSHAHLSHLIEQAVHSREHLLGPAQRLYELTRRSFAAGEANVLALVDAHNTYFDARTRYLELLHQGWLTAAEVRLAAGQSLHGGEVTQ